MEYFDELNAKHLEQFLVLGLVEKTLRPSQ